MTVCGMVKREAWLILAMLFLSQWAYAHRVMITFRDPPEDFRIMKVVIDSQKNMKDVKKTKSSACGKMIALSDRRIILESTHLKSRKGKQLPHCLQGKILTSYSTFTFTTREGADCLLAQESPHMMGKRDCFDATFLSIEGDNTLPLIDDTALEVFVLKKVFEKQEEE